MNPRTCTALPAGPAAETCPETETRPAAETCTEAETRPAAIDTVIFDFDGTIMDTNEVIIQSWQHTFRTLENREEDRSVIIATFGEVLEDTMRKFFPDIPEEQSLKVYRDYQRENFLNDIQLFDGIPEVLQILKDRGFRMGLATSRLQFTTQQALDKYDLNRFFDSVITADDVTRHKPDPQTVQIVLEQLGARPECALMVGDSLYDILCARNAGVRSVLVSWSITLSGRSFSDFAPGEAPDFIIDHPSQLLELL